VESARLDLYFQHYIKTAIELNSNLENVIIYSDSNSTTPLIDGKFSDIQRSFFKLKDQYAVSQEEFPAANPK
jgi:hypothetical protein